MKLFSYELKHYIVAAGIKMYIVLFTVTNFITTIQVTMTSSTHMGYTWEELGKLRFYLAWSNHLVGLPPKRSKNTV